MQKTIINIDETTPIGAIPLEVFKETMLQICSDFLNTYLEEKEKQNDRGEMVKGLRPILKELGFGKDIFYQEMKKGHLDGVVRQNGWNTTYYGYVKELRDKGAEIIARRQIERRRGEL